MLLGSAEYRPAPRQGTVEPGYPETWVCRTEEVAIATANGDRRPRHDRDV